MVQENMASPQASETSPRISFSPDFLNEADFISITPNSLFNKQSSCSKPELERPGKISLSRNKNVVEDDDRKGHGKTASFNVDEEPSPRPPKCAVLWRDLLRMRKQRRSSLGEHVAPSEKLARRVKKGGMERGKSTSASVRIRPMVNASSFPPLFTLKKG